MKKIIPIMGSIAVYAALAELNHAAAGLLAGVLWGVLVEYVFNNFFRKEHHDKVVGQHIRLVIGAHQKGGAYNED